jgi:hypothetical protein
LQNRPIKSRRLEAKQPEMKTDMLIEVLRYPKSQQETVKEVAETLEDILQCVERGETSLP